jgi:asparagine synthase (glutamine-hydrolysing)
MHSASGRYTIVYNGEVYNFQRIRAELEPLGHRFRGHSDTEVMLAAFEEWGIGAALRRFVGMFAFGLWDAQQRELTLARDRLGKKPLYYSLSNGRLIFGSELKALRAFPGLDFRVDRQALALYLRHLYIPAPHSIYEAVGKLEAAHFVRFAARSSSVVELERQCYWDAAQVQAQAVAHAPVSSLDEATEQLDQLPCSCA